jgi:hypothetical protein
VNEEGKIEIEEVGAAEKPPKARVDDAEAPRDIFERKRDYLEGFLSQAPVADPAGQPGGDLYEAVIGSLKEIYDPEIPVNIYDLGLIYGVDITDDGHAVGDDDADDAALPGRGIDARRSRAARRLGARCRPCRRSISSGIRHGIRRR